MSVDLNAEIFAFCSIFLASSVISLFLRFWSRYVTKTRWWWDDWFVIIATGCVVINVAYAYWVAVLGVGKHIWDVPTENVDKMGGPVRFTLVFGILYDVGMTFVKLSVMGFYLRMFHNSRGFVISVWVTGALCVAWGIAFLTAGVTCRTTYSCSNLDAMTIVEAATELGLDIIILALPHFQVSQLNLERPKKFWLSFIFLTGYCVIGCSIARVVLTARDTDFWRAEPGLYYSVDWTYKAAPEFLAGILEALIAITSVNLPSIYALWKHGELNGREAMYTRRGPSKGSSQHPSQGSHCSVTERAGPVKPMEFTGPVGLAFTTHDVPSSRDSAHPRDSFAERAWFDIELDDVDKWRSITPGPSYYQR